MIALKADRFFRRFEDVTPEILKAEKVSLLLCDLDNTLRVRGEKEPSEELKAWALQCSEAGVKIVVVSNNIHKNKLKHFCKILGVPCVGFARKPFGSGLIKSIKKYGRPEESAMLGDKRSTDILAAKIAGIRAWQVKARRKIL